MKPIKKKPRKQLEKFSTIFTQIGLVLALFVVYAFMELETEEKKIAALDYESPSKVFILQDETPVFRTEEKTTPKVETPNSVLIIDEPFKEADNKTDETEIILKPTKEVTIDINTLVTEKEPEDDIPIETVPYISIQNTPVFKGCEGLSEKENKICFDEKMKKHVQRNFDGNLAERLGLRSGKYRIQTQFIIDDKGNVVDIQIRAPHQKLEKETLDLIEKLPKFTPGKQQNRNVKVRFTLPITFYID